MLARWPLCLQLLEGLPGLGIYFTLFTHPVDSWCWLLVLKLNWGYHRVPTPGHSLWYGFLTAWAWGSKKKKEHFTGKILPKGLKRLRQKLKLPMELTLPTHINTSTIFYWSKASRRISPDSSVRNYT